MKGIKALTIICWVVTACALAGLAIWFLTGSVFGYRGGAWPFRPNVNLNFGNFEMLTGPYYEVGTYTTPASGLDSIDINWIHSDVSVEPYDGAEIKITEYAQRDLNDNEKMYITTAGSTITIRFSERSINTRTPQKRLEVLVPRALSTNLVRLNADTMSGTIRIESIGAGMLSADTTSGSIRINNSSATQLLDVNSMSGSINVSNIQAGDLNIDSTSGSVTVNSAQTNGFEINSMSGSIRVSDSSARRVNIDSTSGSVNVAGLFDDIKINTMSGRITLNNSASSSAINIDSTSGTVDLTGSFDRVNVDTMSGSVTVKSSTVPSSLKVDTTSGSIRIHVPNEGSITVHHSSTSGSFSSDIPVVLQNRDAQFVISTMSGSTKIHEYR